MKFIAIIPARYASSRFPGKPLAMLGGKTVIERVCARALEAVGDVAVATDDERIMRAAEAAGVRAVMTLPELPSGTDRVRAAYEALGSDADVVVNVQGDEPFILPEQIKSLCVCFDDPRTQIATLVRPFGREATYSAISNPNTPKVVTDSAGFALYFSRSVIPHLRDCDTSQWPMEFDFLAHVGVYAYRADVLREITLLPPSPLEKAERLEQLRWLQAGYRIKTAVTNVSTIGIDTPADLRRAEEFLAKQ